MYFHSEYWKHCIQLYSYQKYVLEDIWWQRIMLRSRRYYKDVENLSVNLSFGVLYPHHAFKEKYYHLCITMIGQCHNSIKHNRVVTLSFAKYMSPMVQMSAPWQLKWKTKSIWQSQWHGRSFKPTPNNHGPNRIKTHPRSPKT